ncbi:MAG: hypothetical protein V3W31_00670, partial [Thermodesulfobacteriota bacterium]
PTASTPEPPPQVPYAAPVPEEPSTPPAPASEDATREGECPECGRLMDVSAARCVCGYDSELRAALPVSAEKAAMEGSPRRSKRRGPFIAFTVIAVILLAGAAVFWSSRDAVRKEVETGGADHLAPAVAPAPPPARPEGVVATTPVEADRAQAEAERKAAELKAAEEKAAAEKAAAEKKAAREKAAAEKVAAEKKAQEKAAAEKLAREKAAAEKAAREKAAAEKAAQKKAAQEKAAQKKAAEEKAAAEKATREKAAAEKAAREKAAQEKAAAEKAALDPRVLKHGKMPVRVPQDIYYAPVLAHLKKNSSSPVDIDIKECTEVFYTDGGWLVGCDWWFRSKTGELASDSKWFVISHDAVVNMY